MAAARGYASATHQIPICSAALSAKAVGTTSAGVKLEMAPADPSTAPIETSAATATIAGNDESSNCVRKNASHTAYEPAW